MANLTIKEINTGIMWGNFTNDELQSVIAAVTYARAQLGAKVKRAIVKGATVKFTSTRDGLTRQGTVEKIAIKYVTVNTLAGRWKVPANMLEVV
jgi:hypothetical protein